MELGKAGLDCLIIGELDLGRVCHCIAATLATLASHETCAGFIMAAPGSSSVKSLLALSEVEDDEGFTHAGGLAAGTLTGHAAGSESWDSELCGPLARMRGSKPGNVSAQLLE